MQSWNGEEKGGGENGESRIRLAHWLNECNGKCGAGARPRFLIQRKEKGPVQDKAGPKDGTSTQPGGREANAIVAAIPNRPHNLRFPR